MSKLIEIALGVKSRGYCTTNLTDAEYTIAKERISAREDVTVSDSTMKNKSKMLTFNIDIARLKEKFFEKNESELEVLALKEYRTRGYGDDLRRELLSGLGLKTSTVSPEQKDLKAIQKSDPDEFKIIYDEIMARKAERDAKKALAENN